MTVGSERTANAPQDGQGDPLLDPRARVGVWAILAALTAFTAALVVSALYVTSAVAGVLRHGVASQPLTGIAIALGTATPHMAVAVVVAFAVSVFIAHQLRHYRRDRDVAETALRRSEERLRALIEHGADGVSIVDAHGVVVYESPSMQRMLGHPPEEMLGAGAATYLHPDDLPAVRAAYAAAIAQPTVVECRVRRRDGSWCEAEMTITNLLDQPAVQGVVVDWRDVGERKRAERERDGYVRDLAAARDRALASTRAKSMFLANVSHEIRTPMNVILGMTEMVLDGPLAAEQRDSMERVHAAAVGLLGIINDILDTAKIEAGKMHLEIVQMDLRQTLADAVSLHATAAARKGLRLTCRLADDCPARVMGDPTRVRQTVVNLVGNAVKFTQTGTVDVSAQVVRRSGAQVVLRVAVADTGIGIAAGRQRAIFDSFAQGDVSTTRVYGGTGLGLAICRQLVELMGGRIGVESRPGAGSTFWFEMPVECAGSADVAAA